MRKVEFVRGIIGIILFVIAAIVITISALKSRKEPAITVELYSCYAQGIGEEDETVLSEDLIKIEEEKIINYNGVNCTVVKGKKEPYKNAYYPYVSAVYKGADGEEFVINTETGEVIEYISGSVKEGGESVTESEREEIAKRYANEIRDIEEYKMSYEEKFGVYNYYFVKYVNKFKTTDEIKVILLEDGTLYMLCNYMLGEFDELDKMYEVEQGKYNRGPVLDKIAVDKAMEEEIKKQFGDNVTYEEKDMTIVKKRNGEFAVLVVVDISDENGELIAVREKYYVTWK